MGFLVLLSQQQQRPIDELVLYAEWRRNRQQSLRKTIDVRGVGAINGADYVTTEAYMHTSNVTSANAVSQSPGPKKTSKVVP